ncbi:MAG TPA: 2-C-methyl-D-erythritol 4-phosphate cytidylyltransferase [Marmoricola sp.]|nr:2-C-methyl-D-erythritol 4-phosphate cytidylyltransferase [Marmoricola sp.]
MERTAIVVLAGGVGTRVGAGVNKTLLSIGGVSVVARSVRTALDASPSRVVVVVRAEDREELSAAIQPVLGDDEIWLVDGGVERHDSEWNALKALASAIESGEIHVVAIHDAARPLATADLYRDVVLAARAHGGAIPTVRMDHLIGADGAVVAVQTPQAFRGSDLLAAYRRADEEGFRGTDTASCLERFTDLTIVGVPSSSTNLKVTYPEDLAVAEELLLGS